MKNATFKIFTMSFALLFLTGCYNVHQIWIDSYQSKVGQNIYELRKRYSSPSNAYLKRGEVLLPNGNIEEASDYVFHKSDYKFYEKNGKYPCRYFYEYEPKSGLIVGFRFEEDYKHACVVSGA